MLGCHSVAHSAGEMAELLVDRSAYSKAAESAVNLENSKAGPTAVLRVVHSVVKWGRHSVGRWAVWTVESSAVPSVYWTVALTVESLENQKVDQTAVSMVACSVE